jgi:hypothetical protein
MSIRDLSGLTGRKGNRQKSSNGIMIMVAAIAAKAPYFNVVYAQVMLKKGHSLQRACVRLLSARARDSVRQALPAPPSPARPQPRRTATRPPSCMRVTNGRGWGFRKCVEVPFEMCY